MARFDSNIALVDDWGVGVGDGAVKAISVADDGRVYLGGSFDTVWDGSDGLEVRPLVASWDEGNLVEDWDPQLEGRVVRTIQRSEDDDVLYLGGQFDRVGDRARGNLAALGAVDGALYGWAPETNGEVNASVLSSELLYVGGAFTELSDALRNRLAAIRADATEGDRAEIRW